jgi:hypothetical protein
LVNTAVGAAALNSNTIGGNNSAFGRFAWRRRCCCSLLGYRP